MWARNFSEGPRWVRGVVVDCLGPLSYLVRMPDSIMWRRHVDHLRKGGADNPIEQTEEPEPEAANTHTPPDASMPLSNPMQAEAPVLPNSDDQEVSDQHELEDGPQAALLDSETLTTQYPIRSRRPPDQLYGIQVNKNL